METKSSDTNMKTNIITLLLWVVGIIIGALAIAAIAAIGDVDAKSENISYVNSVLIAMLVLLVLGGIVSLAVCFMNKSKNNYEVNKDAEKGKENTAFDHGESSKKTGEQNGSTAQPAGPGGEKWVSNYVPFGDFPNGNNAQ
jgi:beta-lactamase regulating signal transducer with metallopeptidase domain